MANHAAGALACVALSSECRFHALRALGSTQPQATTRQPHHSMPATRPPCLLQLHRWPLFTKRDHINTLAPLEPGFLWAVLHNLGEVRPHCSPDGLSRCLPGLRLVGCALKLAAMRCVPCLA